MGVPKNNEQIILVTGATGRQGGAVYQHLQKKGFKLRALVRDPNSNKARQLMRHGEEVFQGSLDDPDSLMRAMDGVYGVFSVQPYTASEIKQGVAVIEAAERQPSRLQFGRFGRRRYRHSSLRNQSQSGRASAIERLTVYDSAACLLHGELAEEVRRVDPERTGSAAVKPDDKLADGSGG